MRAHSIINKKNIMTWVSIIIREEELFCYVNERRIGKAEIELWILNEYISIIKPFIFWAKNRGGWGRLKVFFSFSGK